MPWPPPVIAARAKLARSLAVIGAPHLKSLALLAFEIAQAGGGGGSSCRSSASAGQRVVSLYVRLAVRGRSALRCVCLSAQPPLASADGRHATGAKLVQLRTSTVSEAPRFHIDIGVDTELERDGGRVGGQAPQAGRRSWSRSAALSRLSASTCGDVKR